VSVVLEEHLATGFVQESMNLFQGTLLGAPTSAAKGFRQHHVQRTSQWAVYRSIVRTANVRRGESCMHMLVSLLDNAVIPCVHTEKALNDVILIESSMTKGACSSILLSEDCR
jgi:hypothetical protein